LKYDYVMVDEFQDTNEVQLKIALLLSKGNIAAVGDWKQSIYSFQYAEVENIKNFEQRLKRYKKELNQDRERIDYTADSESIDLKQNYRSTQEILDFSEHSLTLEATDEESIDSQQVLDNITSLESNKDENSSIQAFQSEDEVRAILTKIQEAVGNPEYTSGGEELGYGDIAVLTRSKSFALDIEEEAREHNIPVVFEGGVELFTTRPSILLLAWLRVIHHEDSEKGWAVILDEAGYNIEQIKHILQEQEYPEDMLEFRDSLESNDYVSGISRQVFKRYGIEDGFSSRITEVLQSTFESSYMNTGELIRFIEKSIENDSTYKIDNSSSEEAVTVQTIHSAKGLEYPAVFIADMNQDRFPSTASDNSTITFDELTGIKQKKIYSSEDQFIFDNWKTYLAIKAQSKGYDEERRLLYVAMTRAQNHLFLSASKERPSKFFKNLNIPKDEINADIEPAEVEEKEYNEIRVERPERRSAIKKSPHDEMNLNKNTVGRGKEYGTKVHRFAEKYANGEDIEPSNADEENVKSFIDSLQGEVKAEVPIKIPKEQDDRKILYRGTIDLLHITKDKVEIIDWKTDLSRENHEQYEKQLDIYMEGIQRIFDGKDVEKKIVYTND
jgi:ATP-dependent exoDNAse (exonuclease V) beta subunit (contains helicase and exonuclease domains)